MKSKISCLVMVVTMLLCGSVGILEGGLGVALGKTASQELAEQLVKKGMSETGAIAFARGFGESAAEALVNAGSKVLDDIAIKMAGTAKSLLGEVGEAVALKGGLGKTGMESTMESIGRSMSNVTKGADDLARFGNDAFTGVVRQDMNKFLTTASSGEIKAALGVSEDAAAKLSQAAKSSDGALVGRPVKNLKGSAIGSTENLVKMSDNVEGSFAKLGEESSSLSKSMKSVGKQFRKTGLNGDEVVAKSQADNIGKLKVGEINPYTGQPLTLAEKNAAAQLSADLTFKSETSTFGRFVRNMPSQIGHYGLGALAIVATGVLFMIPSIFEAAFMAQQQQNAMLQTYLPPIKFGNIVMQLPDSVVNLENPAASQFIYYGIPVNNPGEGVSKQAKSVYKGVSGPSSNNKISKSVDNIYARLFAGAKKKIHIDRYNLDATALSNLPILVEYSDQSWQEWGANGIPSAGFSQAMIDLRSGYIFYADGSSQGTPPATLLGKISGGKTVESYLSTKYGSLKTAGMQSTYTEYTDTASASKADKVGSSLAEQFNCKCLGDGVLSAETLQTCSTGKNSSCLLTNTLNQLAAGLVINSQGKVMTPDQDLAKEIAAGALGQVIPIQGYGDRFGAILQMFPGAEQDAIANSGVLTISLGSKLSSATPIKIQGADPDNYPAKGIYIYQCQNTPLAKMLRSQAGGSAAYNNLITDYIVFLDQNLNQVPLMAPVQDPNNYNFIKMDLNPAIAYVSTIIGSFDSNNNFHFLPQLNIQAPSALVSKGLPASFPPLYGLQAKNGSLAVNYNQNLTSVIGSIAQSLSNNPKLGQQFQDIQAAMLRLLSSGPFGKYKLMPVDDDMQPNIGGVNLVVYTGFNSYPVSQDGKNSNCTDVLIPLSDQGKTVVLPSNNVAEYYGLVTDLTYSVKPDGTIFVADDGFANSPLSQQKDAATGKVVWSIDEAAASQFYWINKLTGMGQKADAQFEMPQALVDFVAQARSAWIQWVQSSSTNSSVNHEFSGIAVPGTSNVLTIVGQQALQNGLYIYTCSPNPSPLMQDFFVLTNSLNPSSSDSKLGLMSATSANASTNMLSLVSGQLYNSSGDVVSRVSVDPQALIQSLYRAKPQGFSDDLKAKLNTALAQSNTASQAVVYPFMFGNLQLGIYQADLNAGNYLYLNAAGAGALADFQPSDYLVCVDSYTSPMSIGTKLSSKTQFVVSLVSGQVYGPQGVVDMMAQGALSSIISKLSPSWRAGIAQQIASLTSHLATVAQNQQQQTEQMDAAPVANSGVVTWPQSAVATIIANLANQSYLQSPYDMIKQDPTSRAYVIVSPANEDGSAFMYTFFDVPNNFVDGQGNPMHVGAMYDGQGNLLRVVQGVELASLLQQYGVAIDSAGKQYLGANNILPMMQLDPADLGLRPGTSGRSMIYSNDPSFPSASIVSPISYGNSQFYIYFNTITKSYYAMQVQGSKVSYIDMAGGNVYNLNGQPQVALNPVAVNVKNSSDFLLPYLNIDNFTRCVMKNPATGKYSDFLNLADNFQAFAQDPATGNSCGLNSLISLDGSAANVNLAQMPFPDTLQAMPDLTVANQYNAYWNDASTPVSYAINPAYQWQNLQILPINMQTRAVLNPLPADMYRFARLVMKDKAPFACVFANQFFANAQQSGQSSYTLTSGNQSITVSILNDPKTNVQYVAIVAGNVTYNYQFNFLTLSATQLQDYQQNAWKAKTVADVTGRVILEESLPVDDSGDLQIASVSMKSVLNPPADSASQSSLNNNLGNLVLDPANGRFLAQISAGMYDYVPQDGFVDIENGVLFDASGQMLGYTLQVQDLVNLLQQLGVSVVRNKNSNQSALRYRSTVVAPAQNSGASKTQAFMPASNVIPGTKVGLPNSTVTSSSDNNAAIVALQNKNQQIQADITQKQSALAREKVPARKVGLQNAIAIDKQQIQANNKQISSLSNSSVQSRSGILGRLSSKLFKKKSKKNR